MKINMNIKSLYRTKDLYEASLLYAKRQKFLGLEKDGKFYWFLFENKSECEKFSTAYWAGEIKVNAKAFAVAIKTLKERIFAQNYEK